MSLISELRANDKKGLFTSNDTFVNYSTGILPLDYANGFWLDVRTPDGEIQAQPITGIIGGTFVSVIGSTGSGKAQPDSTLVPTPFGKKRLDKLKIGDLVFNIRGEAVPVTGIFPQGEKDVYQVTFSDGRKTCCCIDHLWTIVDPDGRTKVIPLKDMIDNYEAKKADIKNLLGYNSAYKYTIPNCPRLEYECNEKLPINPWALGVLIGCGYLREEYLTLATQDETIPIKFANMFKFRFIKSEEFQNSYNFKLNGEFVLTKDFLKDIPELLNLFSYKKKIPKVYKYSSVSERKQILSGLLDTDGIICKNSGRVIHRSSSKILEEDIIEICRSLGYNCYKLTYSSLYSRYKIQIECPNNEKTDLFTCDNKLDIAIDTMDMPPKIDHSILRLIKIEKLDRESQRCIMIDDPDHVYITEGFIPTHNTTIADQMGYNIIKDFEDGLLDHIDAERTALKHRMIQVMGTDMEDERIVLTKTKTSIEDVLEKINRICEIKNNGGDLYKYDVKGKTYNGKTFRHYIPTVFIIDSLPSFNSKEYNVEDLGTNMDQARAAKDISRFYNNALDRMQEFNITIFTVNHIRPKIETNPYAVPPPGLMMLKQTESLPRGEH